METMTSEEYRALVGQVNPHRPDQPALRNYLHGKRAQSQGRQFEESIDEASDIMVGKGLLAAYIRQYPPMVPTMRGKELLYRATGPGPCDRVFGLNSGIFGIFDMKTATGNGFTWPKKSEHQLEELRRVDGQTDRRSPAFALVLWVDRPAITLHPIGLISGRRIRFNEGYRVDGLDWLTTARWVWSIQ